MMFGAHNLRVLVLTLTSLAGVEAKCADFATGVSMIEEGDDRPRVGGLLHVGIQDIYRARLHFYGRDVGPVKERTYLLSGVRHITPFKSTMLKAAIGLAVMNERISLAYPTDSSLNVNEDNLNVGGVFGLSLHVPKGPLYFSVDWDAHVFPAGAAGILLATGRKQTISIAMGVSLR
jgi:hypothetical protein